jgi:hypothetical protein
VATQASMTATLGERALSVCAVCNDLAPVELRRA